MLLRLLEKSFELKTRDYEEQIQTLKEEIKVLKDEKLHLQHQLEEEQAMSEGLKGEVARLSKQAKVGAVPDFSMSSLAGSSDLNERKCPSAGERPEDLDPFSSSKCGPPPPPPVPLT